jgi:hypothetical protein
VNDTVKPILYTAWCDYFGTGEGRTMIGLITKARDERDMREIVHHQLGEFWSVYANVAIGVVRNEVTERLWSSGVFEFLERSGADAGMVMAKCELHANFS